MTLFTVEDLATLGMGIHWLNVWFHKNVAGHVYAECNYTPDEISGIDAQIKAAKEHLHSFSGRTDSVELDSTYFPVYRQAIIVGRQWIANSIELRGRNIHHGEIKTKLQKELEPYDRFTLQQWFQDTRPVDIPRLTAFVSVQRAEFLLTQSDPLATLTPRVYDEKFHILQAPVLFEKDLHCFRCQCDLRGSAVAAAFLDIDDFKKRFNSPYGNDRIDREVLPIFMETIESHLFGRGYGYRQEGDEYLILMPSVSFHGAIKVLDELRTKLSEIEYLGINQHTTVSIGLCYVGQGCFLTDKEVREKATRASAYAKQPKDIPRKNCVATYRDARYGAEDLYIAAPEQSDI